MTWEERRQLVDAYSSPRSAPVVHKKKWPGSDDEPHRSNPYRQRAGHPWQRPVVEKDDSVKPAKRGLWLEIVDDD